MKHAFYLICLVFFVLSPQHVLGQSTQYGYDNAGRLTSIIYPNQMVTSYTYDKDGNRILQTTAIITPTTSPTDSLALIKQGVRIHPNPSNGNFTGEIYAARAQKVTIEVFNAVGSLLLSYQANIEAGYNEFKIMLSPVAAGAYLLTVRGPQLIGTQKVIVTAN